MNSTLPVHDQREDAHSTVRLASANETQMPLRSLGSPILRAFHRQSELESNTQRAQHILRIDEESMGTMTNSGRHVESVIAIDSDSCSSSGDVESQSHLVVGAAEEQQRQPRSGQSVGNR